MDGILGEFHAHLPTTNVVPEGLNGFGLVEWLNVYSNFHELGRVALQGFLLMLLEGKEVTNYFT